MDTVQSEIELVTRIAKRRLKNLRNAGMEKKIDLNALMDDFMQEGHLRLAQVRKEFDKSKGVEFEIFAREQINWAISDYLRRLDILSQHERQEINKLKKTQNELRQILQREPKPEEIAHKMSVSIERFYKMANFSRMLVSIYPESGEEHLDSIEISIPDGKAIKHITKGLNDKYRVRLGKDTQECLESLNNSGKNREKTIILLRYYQERTLEDIALTLGSSVETVRRKQKKAEIKMKKCLEKKGWGIEDVLGLVNT